MNKTIILLASCGLFAVGLSAACGSSDDTSSPAATATTGSNTTTSSTATASGGGGGTTTSSTAASMGGGGGNVNPKPPTLGAQVDRAGRPAINTALTDPFDGDATAENGKKDAYNADADPTKWAANYAPAFAKSLAILDSLDTNCGNQFLAASGAPTTMTYATLAGALTGDELWLDSSATTCMVYLGVEANATGKIPNTDCGGRTLDEDVIDETYSLVAIGAPSGVGDGVDANDVANSTTFPYLAAPH